MASGPRYRVQLRRRREGKTDYYQRRELLKSGKIRVVIRKSTKHMIVQFIEALPDGDITLSQANSYNLDQYGWKLTGGNIPAAYLTGYLAGKKALDAGIEEGILDLGLQTNQRGSRIYATLKGVIDAGIEVPASDWIFPDEEILNGEHIQKASESLKEQDKDNYEKLFSKYVSNKVKPEDLPKVVDKTKGKIDKKF